MPAQPVSFRFSEEFNALFRRVQEQTGLNPLDVVHLAVRLLARTWELAPALAAPALPEELRRVRDEASQRKRGRKPKKRE
jgi:hypothetical protein